MTSTRRQFLVNGARISAALPFASGLSFGASRDNDTVLVVLQLSGGNDGLNTVVPHRQDAYFRLRPTLSIARGDLVALDDEHGLHPSLGGIGRLFDDGRVAVVHGVGYPEPNRSHFRSMEIWHTADPIDAPTGVGWMGRLSDQLARRTVGALPALHIGDGELPLALYARDSFAPTVRDASGFELRGSAAFRARRDALLRDDRAAGELTAFLRSAASTSYRAAARMEQAAARHSGTEYPGYALAQRLRLVAQLVSGGFDTRLFHVELGGFDTHARQAPAHTDLLRELSESVAAFQRDLTTSGVAKRVLTLVFSEFGRRAAENGSRGTDHGAAAPVLLIGDGVRGGLHGRAPDLARLEEGDVPFSTDFRSVYTTLERDWLGLEPSTSHAALDVLG